MEATTDDPQPESGPSGIFAGYADEHRPLGSYAALATVAGSLLSGSLLVAKTSGRLPDDVGTKDLLLVGAATHKVSRLISKDSITSFVRAPFTEYEEHGGPGEVNESPRGRGPRLAIGELLACPFCVSHWVASSFLFGLVFAPRATRLVAGIFATQAMSDFLQLAYSAAEQRAE
jgi:hypothetical protein